MKILLVCPFFPPEVGSAAHLYWELGQALKARGHEVTVLTGLPRYHVVGEQRPYRRRPCVYETYQGFRVLRVFNLDIPWNVPVLRGLDQFWSAVNFGLAGLFLSAFDIALVYSPPLPLALSAYVLSRLKHRPCVLNVQDLFPKSAVDLGVLKNPSLIRLFAGLEAFLYRHFAAIVVHSQGNRDYLLERGAPPSRVTVIPNWVDTEAIRPGPKSTGLRAALGLNDSFIVSFAGIMGYSQDLDTVLDSAQLLQAQAGVAFLLVGDGVEKPRLEQKARERNLDNVHFLPMQPKEEYPKVLAASDLCLVTLRKEVRTPVVPSKIMSIMAAGRPVLASLPLEGDAPRLIAAAGCGVCLPPEAPEAMAREILKLYGNASLREQMGVNGRNYAVQHLSLQVNASRLEALFEQALGQYHH